MQDTVKFPQVQYIDRISLYQFQYHVKHQPSRAARVAVVPVVLQRQEPTFHTVQETLEWRTLRVLPSDGCDNCVAMTSTNTVALLRSHFTGRQTGTLSRQVSRVQLHTGLTGTPSACRSLTDDFFSVDVIALQFSATLPPSKFSLHATRSVPCSERWRI